MQHWMKTNRIKSCPIETLVAIGDPSTKLETNPGMYKIFQKIHQAEQIPDRMVQLENQCKEKSLTPYLIQKLSETILHQLQQPSPINLLEKYSLSSTELLHGVRCPTYSAIPNLRIHGSWYCPLCQATNKQAHVQTIEDHLHILGSLTNKQCRHCFIQNIDLATRFLTSMNLPSQAGNFTDKNLPPSSDINKKPAWISQTGFFSLRPN